MKLKELIAPLEEFAPLSLQESYDNSGLLVGDPEAEITAALLTLDITLEVLEEALSRGCNMVIAHHPIIFGGIKRLTGRNHVEQIVIKAIKENIALYACHTNLDNVRMGVNAEIAKRLGLKETNILAPISGNLIKLQTFVPVSDKEKVLNALFGAGAGAIGDYTECSYTLEGSGTFRPGEAADPAIGEPGGKREEVTETKIEVLMPQYRQQQVLTALVQAHPYEEVAYDLITLNNVNQDTGSGLIGLLENPVTEVDFLHHIRREIDLKCIRHTPLSGKKVTKVAVCGGSGSFLLPKAIAAGADFFITADFKYHEFFSAEGNVVIADIGHYESEQHTVNIFAAVLQEKFPNFAVLLSKVNTNPINYFC